MEPSTSTTFAEKLKELRSRIANGLSTTDASPIGREEQFTIIQNHVKSCFNDKKGGAIYASGLPGTGKSMTIHRVLGSLWTVNSSIEVPPVVVSINCMMLTAPTRIYEVLLESYHQHKSFDDPYQIYYLQKMPRTSHSRNAFAKLQDLVNEELPTKKSTEVDRPIVGRKRQKRTSEIDRGMIVVFLDELDSLITKDSTLIKEVFSLALSSHRLILIGASNSLDLSDRITAPSMPEMVPFPAYKSNEVAGVLKKLFEDCEDKVLTDRGIEFLARKSATSGMGDMRNVLQICLSSLSSIDESSLTQKDDLIDVKDLVKIFEGSEEFKPESSTHSIASLPLDQQILLFAVYHQSVAVNEESGEPPKKKLTAAQKLAMDPLNLVNVYQKYSDLCQSLYVDCSSKADISCIMNILADLGLISHEKHKKQTLVRLKTSLETLKEFYSNTRLFSKIL